MNKFIHMRFIILFLITIIHTSWSQNCDFRIRNLSNTLNGESIIIEQSEYEKINVISEELIEVIPFSELELTKKYPKIFKLKDSCYSFLANRDIKLGIKTPELKACKNDVKSKTYSNYKFKGVYCKNALIEIFGYESWGFLSVDLKNGLTCYTMGMPLTSNGETAISFSNYYGEEEIALTDLKTKKQYVIGIEDWTTIEYKINGNTYYLKLESNFKVNCKKELQFLEIKN